MYADDTQLYQSCSKFDIDGLVTTMGNCINGVQSWMIDNKLKMNEEKTEILLCNSLCKIEIEKIPNITIGSNVIPYGAKAKNLGVFFDENLNMEPQINSLCKQMFCELRRIGQISHLLDMNSVKTLISAFLFSRLDYCNSLLVNLSDKMIEKLQRFQNRAARLVLRRSTFDHVTPMLHELHWLPVRARLDYKIAVLCYKSLNKTGPVYLKDLLHNYSPMRQLRSASQVLLTVPKVNYKTVGERSFSYYAPKLWNSLPLDLRSLTSEQTFKKSLKTYLFRLFLE